MVVVAPAQSPAAGAPKVLLLSGQPAATGGAPAGRALPVMVPGQQGASPEGASGVPPQARKRQRLTHLSPEEKALRRKLKNRVAAQTARDRKKARMSELEQQVVDLEEENQKLLLENQLLREKTHGLVVENQELRQRLGMDALVTEEEAETKGNGAGLVAGSAESAALRLRAPLQQVQAQLSPLQNISPWTLMALTLQTLSLTSCWAFCSTWTQSCSSDVLPQSLPAWSSSQKWTQKDPVPYRPPLLHPWGRHQPSWKPLMN
ncbi:X-box-binding protein 1 isoform XBP1(U) [Bos taurus]|uniref:X-box-binding protein 1 n=1 Tax=Bos taurus TaxID=9913 RepID=XBP1_BOVIN|nr:X-box-binding protein 1 isoform XBP1(U) [Bos taurus]Q3SZZ2.1 RecName: Full=X-box-binding protein 1; Short=XBP-1; Contains: RecName: Full=X-box-binding protein 1, cytoplasmic form; Contains: RecName: Full=X-box-binding protein 1, luminal form [Bos taurus]AAI02640.1 X-box binding protein pseudogene 1 [Bos taurus]DAA20534.1 TPA: X-box-binding protein 1 [Bos taurus]